jgi:hypothetical protein
VTFVPKKVSREFGTNCAKCEVQKKVKVLLTVIVCHHLHRWTEKEKEEIQKNTHKMVHTHPDKYIKKKINKPCVLAKASYHSRGVASTHVCPIIN